MRGLSKRFVDELKSGFLQPVLELVQGDPILCLEIRENYINIYYRGGNILKITESGNAFDTSFDRKYLDENVTRVPMNLPLKLWSKSDVMAWIEAIPFLKHEMDLWFGKHPKNEREFQQMMLRENNFRNSAARGTDYFICDIEYANRKGKFDLVAVHWPSTNRKRNTGLCLAFIEMKYGYKALKGSAGLAKHIQDIDEFLSDDERVSNIKAEMINVFNQKLELGLIDCGKSIESLNNDGPECIIALAEHNPNSSILKKELDQLPPCTNVELRFAVSTFMGYGLYDENIYTLDDFKKRFLD